MQPTKQMARNTGLLYLGMVVAGPFSLLYVPGKVIVPGDAAATSANVLAHETLFRAGIAATLVGNIVFLLLAFALYRLLSGVSKVQAGLMVTSVAIAVAIAYVNEVLNIAALTLFHGGEFLAVLSRQQLDALGMAFIRLHSQGNFVDEMLWGLWLIPFGVLVMKSGFLPRILGALLVLNGGAWIVSCLVWMLAPQYGRITFNAFQPAYFGEIWIMLWLLIKGVRDVPRTAAQAA